MQAIVYNTLPLSQRRTDSIFIGLFFMFACTSAIADTIPTLGIPITEHSPNMLARMNYMYAYDTDPLFLHPPIWMRVVTGFSAFVYGPFYLLLAYAFLKGKNWIHTPALLYCGAMLVQTSIVMIVEFFGEPEYRVLNIPKFLAVNSLYILGPLALLIRMRKPLPFTREF